MTAVGFLGAIARGLRRGGLARPLGAVRDALDRVFLRTGRPPLRAHTNGVEIRGFLRHRSFLADLDRGYEEYLTRVFAEAVRPGATVVDGGAHIGLHSILASKLTGPGGRVLAFEPDPYNHAALRVNLARNGCSNTFASRQALAETPGRATLHQSLGTVSSSLNVRDSRFGPFRTVPVELTNLTSALDGVTGEVVVKLDLEGGELSALKGLGDVSRYARFVAFVEANPDALAAAGVTTDDLVRRLQSHGLDCRWVDESTRSLVPYGFGELTRKGNLRCERT